MPLRGLVSEDIGFPNRKPVTTLPNRIDAGMLFLQGTLAAHGCSVRLLLFWVTGEIWLPPWRLAYLLQYGLMPDFASLWWYKKAERVLGDDWWQMGSRAHLQIHGWSGGLLKTSNCLFQTKSLFFHVPNSKLAHARTPLHIINFVIQGLMLAHQLSDMRGNGHVSSPCNTSPKKRQ